MTGVTAGLRGLLGRLQAYKVDWRFSFVPTENEAYEPGIDREKTADLNEANVISSTRLGYPMDYVYDGNEPSLLKRDEGGQLIQIPRHAVLLDIDYPAHLVESSTPEHYHLYLDPPLGVKHEDYMELLALLAKCGIIEQGYADVSIARGHSDLRLPWVSKDDQKTHPSDGLDVAHGPEVVERQDFDDVVTQQLNQPVKRVVTDDGIPLAL